MRLGVFGGAFDPIHFGHLRAAANAAFDLHLDRVLLMPTGAAPHRPQSAVSGAERFAMTCLAAAGDERLAACNDEVRREGPSYTVDTLAALHERYPGASLHLILGSDAAAGFASWREPQRILSLCRVAVVSRPGAPSATTDVGFEHDTVSGTTLAISATVLRGLAREGRSLRYLVPDAVAQYIDRKRLYR